MGGGGGLKTPSLSPSAGTVLSNQLVLPFGNDVIMKVVLSHSSILFFPEKHDLYKSGSVKYCLLYYKGNLLFNWYHLCVVFTSPKASVNFSTFDQ